MQRLRLKNRCITNPHRSLPHSLGMMRRPESSYEHKWMPHQGINNNKKAAWLLKTHGWRTYGVTPGCMSDPRNDTMVTKAAAERRFRKWCDMPWGGKARMVYWRARPDVAKKMCDKFKKPS